MEYTSFRKIDINTIKNNLQIIKNCYKYKYYILDVSNDAFGHDISITKDIDVDYLYVNSLDDVFAIRKYNKDLPIILNSLINQDQLLDVINNNVILEVSSILVLEKIQNEKLFAPLNIILNIDSKGYLGFKNKKDIINIVEIFKNNDKLKLLGMRSQVEEKDFHDFLYIINDLLRLDLELFILNDENDKRKIKYSNAIKLDKSVYGINDYVKGKFLSKIDTRFTEAFGVYTRVVNIKKEINHKKEIYNVVIPLGYLNGMLKDIKKVFINNKLYSLKEINDVYSIIEGDSNINTNDIIEIIGPNNPLQNYIKDNTLVYFSYFKNIKIKSDEEENNYLRYVVEFRG